MPNVSLNTSKILSIAQGFIITRNGKLVIKKLQNVLELKLILQFIKHFENKIIFPLYFPSLTNTIKKLDAQYNTRCSIFKFSFEIKSK